MNVLNVNDIVVIKHLPYRVVSVGDQKEIDNRTICLRLESSLSIAPLTFWMESDLVDLEEIGDIQFFDVKDTVNIFCYGTLKKGFYNHRMLGSKPVFLGEDSVPGELYGGYGLPFMTLGIEKVKGEVYEIPHYLFNMIAEMEINAGYYEKELNTLDKNIPVHAFYYPRKNLDPDAPKIVEFTKQNMLNDQV